MTTCPDTSPLVRIAPETSWSWSYWTPPETVLVIHAMPLRQTTSEELFGDEGR